MLSVGKKVLDKFVVSLLQGAANSFLVLLGGVSLKGLRNNDIDAYIHGLIYSHTPILCFTRSDN